MTAHSIQPCRGVLDVIREFHRLRVKRERTGLLDMEEGRRLSAIRDLLEPRRITFSGSSRQPVVLRVRRAALLRCGADCQRTQVTRIALRRVEVELRRPARLGTDVRLAVAGPLGRKWFAFRGRIVALDEDGRSATVLLCQSSH